MRFQQIRDILTWTQTFHRTLGEQYESLARGPVKERVSMLLHYLADHEKVLQEAIRKYEADAPEGLLNTWFDRAPENSLPSTSHELMTQLNQAETKDVIAMAIHFHDVLIALYTQLRNLSNSHSVQELFDNLIQLEHHEKLRMVRDAMGQEDC